MALAPAPMPAPADAGAMPPDDAGAPDPPDTVLATICQTADGTFMVYSGDEPEEAEAPTPGEAAEPPAMEGKSADSIGAALKLTMDILKSAEDRAGGDQFDEGFDKGNDASPPNPGLTQKY